MIISPHTQRSTDLPHLIEQLQAWTSEPTILAAVFRAGKADPPGIAMLAKMVAAGAELYASSVAKPDQDDTLGAELESRIASAALFFLDDPNVRSAVARHVADLHREEIARGIVEADATRDKATPAEILRVARRDLYELRAHLQAAYDIEAAADLPEWLLAYVQEDVALGPQGVEMLRHEAPPCQEIAKRLPPGCVVTTATADLQCPTRGDVAVVLAYRVNGERVDVMVAPSHYYGEPRYWVDAELLHFVAPHGHVTGEAVEEALAGPEEQ